MSKRLIYAEDVLEILDRDKAYMSDVGRIHARNAVNEAPTAEGLLVEKTHGRWREVLTLLGLPWNVRCDQCGCPQDYKHNYCPNCGADMRGEEDGN